MASEGGVFFLVPGLEKFMQVELPGSFFSGLICGFCCPGTECLCFVLVAGLMGPGPECLLISPAFFFFAFSFCIKLCYSFLLFFL